MYLPGVNHNKVSLMERSVWTLLAALLLLPVVLLILGLVFVALLGAWYHG